MNHRGLALTFHRFDTAREKKLLEYRHVNVKMFLAGSRSTTRGDCSRGRICRSNSLFPGSNVMARAKSDEIVATSTCINWVKLDVIPFISP